MKVKICSHIPQIYTGLFVICFVFCANPRYLRETKKIIQQLSREISKLNITPLLYQENYFPADPAELRRLIVSRFFLR